MNSADIASAAPCAEVEAFESALLRLERAPGFAKASHVNRALYAAKRLLQQPGGVAQVAARAHRFDAAGVFVGTDWAAPDRLQSKLVPVTIKSAAELTVVLEFLSQLRLLACARQQCFIPGMSAELAEHFLKDVLALCLEYLMGQQTEEARAARERYQLASNVLRFIADELGYEDLMAQLVDEIWRLLRQRPVQVDGAREMITRLATYCFPSGERAVAVPAGAESLISALFGPTPACREDPGLAVYEERLATMHAQHLGEEASAAARSMWDTGLVSVYHAALVRYLARQQPDLVSQALGLSATGLDSLLSYRDLVYALIEAAVFPATSQSVFGLASTLERAVLHQPGVAPSLWRQLQLPLSAPARQRIQLAYGEAVAAEAYLTAGVLSVLGLPLGIGQGDNPTCQAARALSLWSCSDPDYLLQLLAWAARDDNIQMKFHGREIDSGGLPAGGAGSVGLDLDPVSLVLAPHLDRVYAEMSRLAQGQGEDPHEYVNPEFHGWRVGKGFALAVDVATGLLQSHEEFVRLFYACFHPGCNGGVPVLHPQLVGIAATDSLARFIGWHAITVMRVALDQLGEMRVYFYNPNNDKGQDWGNDVVVSTEGHGEFYGESSLPFAHFVSRVYLFHYDSAEVGDTRQAPADEVAAVAAMAQGSWARERC
ncbi:hypothetical protein DWB85_14975 [Seongchinamella sediminis]|uniref:Uncharacterized protein n=1 Tax=Seongchinamella sediminis TaxID=2283635 RepID=A0A3L7DYE2_9GAMM|nr:hypothetical protein [Seongchinamella sediminis]RLQ21021.1 hypothetical protein DWB85_14975 [Seongchinamella sediminis]